MPPRRILSLWFPRLGAERLMRREPGLQDIPFAVVCDRGNMQTLAALSGAALAAGLRPDQPLRDATAMCPDLVTRLQNPQAEAGFLDGLCRWATRFSPWVATSPPDGLALDITGCAHLFGGEAGLLAEVEDGCTGFGLTLRAGIADTLGAAWALAHYGGRAAGHHRSGDAVDMEARATRSRAVKRRHWTRGGLPPRPADNGGGGPGRIAPPGQTRQSLAPLPVAALRLDEDLLAQLARLGLRRIGDLTGQPRAPLARRFGTGLVLRLDQALGATPEPISPRRVTPPFATRLTLPEPIGLESDLLAAIDRMLPRLCASLRTKGRGARSLRLQAYRSDGTMQWISASLARASNDPERIRPLLAMKLPEIDAGFGIDMLRLEVTLSEAVHARTHAGHLDATRAMSARLTDTSALDDLIGRLGARVGLETITRRHPASSHIPEKAAQILAAAWSDPAPRWPLPGTPRPMLLSRRPEAVIAPDDPMPPIRFRWRNRDLALAEARGPERIAPEWWLDDPDWRSGVRDYWHVTTSAGEALWLFYAHGGALSSGWFCQGRFA